MQETSTSANTSAARRESPQRIRFSGLEVLKDRPAAQVYFELTNDDGLQAEDMSFVVHDDGAGADALIARGYDAFIAALHQMSQEAATQREGYRRNKNGAS